MDTAFTFRLVFPHKCVLNKFTKLVSNIVWQSPGSLLANFHPNHWGLRAWSILLPFFFLPQGCYGLWVVSTFQNTLCNFRLSNMVDVEHFVVNVVFSSPPVFSVFTGDAHFLHFIEHPFNTRHWRRDPRLKNKNEQDWLLPTTNWWSGQSSTSVLGKEWFQSQVFSIRRKGHSHLQPSLNVWLSNHFSLKPLV